MIDTVKPTGYVMLVKLMPKEEKTSGGIIRPEQLQDREHFASIVGEVVAMGPDCYVDAPGRRWPNGAWCGVGDFVMFRSYAGTRFKLGDEDQEYRLINDDAVEAVVSQPKLVKRV